MEVSDELEGEQQQTDDYEVRRQQRGEKLLHLAENGQLHELHELLFPLPKSPISGGSGAHVSVDANIEANFQDIDGLTALHWATVRGHMAAAELLLSYGANPNLADRWGISPMLVPYISLATSLQSDEESSALCGGAQHPLLHEPQLNEPVIHRLMELFIGHGGKLNDPTEGLGQHTLLYYALRAGCPETIAGLRLNGADLIPLERTDVMSGQDSYDPAVLDALLLEATPPEPPEPPSGNQLLGTMTRRPARPQRGTSQPDFGFLDGDSRRCQPFPQLPQLPVRTAAVRPMGEAGEAGEAGEGRAADDPRNDHMLEPEPCVTLFHQRGCLSCHP